MVAIHNGFWEGKRSLDGKDAPVISAYFEDIEDSNNPSVLNESSNRVFQGTIPLGEGFLLEHSEAEALIKSDQRNQEIVFPVINGQETNNHPDQLPGRSIINFLSRTEEQAASYEVPFRIIRDRVKPARLAQKNEAAKTRWWRFYRYNDDCYAAIRPLKHCFVVARVTKYLNFSSFPTHYVFLNTTYVFTTDRWDLYTVVQSAIHEVWARKYSMSLKQDLQYSPSDCFETFPFPQGLWKTANQHLAAIGERYHEHRRTLMKSLWLGLTDIYNLFHTRDLTAAEVARVSKKPLPESEAGYQGILELRHLHRELDLAIRDAYGWTDLDLGHDFIEVETLPENDRVRYTISPAARKEVLKRLLAENHRRAAEAAENALVTPTKKARGRKPRNEHGSGDLFDLGITVTVSPAAAARPRLSDLGRFANGAWERPGTEQANEEAAVLAALLKTISGPIPARDIRLAVLFAMRPRLLSPMLTADEDAQWCRVVGRDADTLPTGVTSLQPPDHAWGKAVGDMRARGRLVEDLATDTWAAGTALDRISTEGWPEGRAAVVLEVLQRKGADAIVESLPDSLRSWVNARAA